MEYTLNEFTLMGQIDRNDIKRFEYKPNQLNPDGTQKVKLGAEFYLNVRNATGGIMKVRLITYNRSIIEPLLGRVVLIRGFFKVQSYQNDEGEYNYVTKLVVQENGGVYPCQYASQPNPSSSNSNEKAQEENQNPKAQIFHAERNQQPQYQQPEENYQDFVSDDSAPAEWD